MILLKIKQEVAKHVNIWHRKGVLTDTARTRKLKSSDFILNNNLYYNLEKKTQPTLKIKLYKTKHEIKLEFKNLHSQRPSITTLRAVRPEGLQYWK